MLSILILPVLAACRCSRLPGAAPGTHWRGFRRAGRMRRSTCVIKRQPHTLIYDRGRVQSVVHFARSR